MSNLGTCLLTTSLPYSKRQGKVRDVYDLGEQLLIVSTDRISAFDWILPCGIPSKGIVLTQLSKFWFDKLAVNHHLLSTELPESLQLSAEQQKQVLAVFAELGHEALSPVFRALVKPSAMKNCTCCACIL